MASCVPPSFCYILCYTLGVLGGSVTAVGQRIRGLEDGGRSCLFRQITLHKAILTFICNYYNVGHQIVCRSMAWRVKSF